MDHDNYIFIKNVCVHYDNKIFKMIKEFNKSKKSSKIEIKFANTIEEVCIGCVESGSMTKDLAILIGPSSKYLTTNQFLEAIDSNLKKKLN